MQVDFLGVNAHVVKGIAMEARAEVEESKATKIMLVFLMH